MHVLQEQESAGIQIHALQVSARAGIGGHAITPALYAAQETEQTAINGIAMVMIHGQNAHQLSILHASKKEVVITAQMMAEHGNGEHVLMDVQMAYV
jgi:hypothetical protein